MSGLNGSILLQMETEEPGGWSLISNWSITGCCLSQSSRLESTEKHSEDMIKEKIFQKWSMFCWEANWNLLTESAAWLWNFPKIGRNRKRKWNIFKTDRIDRICNRRPSGQNVTQSWTLYWMCVWKKMPHFCILLSPVKSRARRNDLRFSIRSGADEADVQEWVNGLGL